MSQEAPNILYVGDAQTAETIQTIVQADNGYLYRPTELLEALSIVVAYCPDLVILDAIANRDLAEAVYGHLRSIDAEPILVLDEMPGKWLVADNPAIQVLPYTVNPSILRSAIYDLILDQRHWNTAWPSHPAFQQRAVL